MIHPEFEVTTPQSLASEPDTYRGHEGIRRYFDSFYEAMENVYFEGHRRGRSATGSWSTSPCTPRAARPGSRPSRAPSGLDDLEAPRPMLTCSRSRAWRCDRDPHRGASDPAEVAGDLASSVGSRPRAGPSTPRRPRSRSGRPPSRARRRARRRRSRGRRRRGSRGSTSLEARRRRLAAAVGAGLEDRAPSPRPAGPRSAGPRGAPGPRGRRAGSGARGWRRPVSPAPAAARRAPSRVRGAEARDQLAHRQRREVHDRRGLALVAALELVDALDRLRVERIAGEPVEGVGGEDRDPAAGDARARARRGRRRRRRARSRRSRLIARRCDHDPLDPGQVAARLDLARSPPAATSSPTVGRLARRRPRARPRAASSPAAERPSSASDRLEARRRRRRAPRAARTRGSRAPAPPTRPRVT